mgnify:CR=1 FL=1
MTHTNSVNAYRQTRVKTASQGQLIVMLYQEAVKQLTTAIDLLDSRSSELDQVNNAILKAQDVVTELMVGLDFERGGDVARNLFSLYMFFNNQLMEANFQKSSEPLQKVRKMLADLLEAWSQVVDKGNVEGQQGGLNIAG